MTIRNKILLAFFIVSILGSIYSVVHFYFVSSNLVKQEVLNHLETTAQDRASHIETYLKQDIERLKLITSRNALRNTFKSYNEEPSQEKLETMKDIIESAKVSVDEIERVCVIGLNGIVIATTDDDFIGKNVVDKDFFIKGKEDYVINFVEEDGEWRIIVAGPYILNNEILGVGIAVMKIDVLENIVKDNTGLGETGEVSVFIRKEGETVYLLNRRSEDSVLSDQVENENIPDLIKELLIGGEKVFENILDHRGEKVLAVYRYIEIGEVGLIAKIDRQEALGLVFNKLFQTILFIFGLSVTFFTIVGFFVARGISRPIRRLFNGTEIIEKGNLDYKVGTKSKDEIGELSRYFDKMTMAIKKSRAEVDKKVKKQTAEIEEKALYLNDQKKAILNILEDVDEEKQKTEREKEKIDAILHGIGDAVFVVDDNLKIVMFNKIAVNISGFSEKEAVGQDYKKILKFIYEDSKEENDEFIKKAMESGEIKEMANHTLLIKKDGTKVPVADSASPLIKDGKVRGCVVVFRDVSSEREIDKAKTEFVSLASHQLRTPLSSINWYAEMLIDEDAGKLNKQQKEYLEQIYKGNQRMVGLVNALLDVSRLELGTFSIEPEKTDITKLIEAQIKEQKPSAEKKKIAINKKIEENLPKINVDPKLVGIIIQNLFSNAIKYTPKGGKIDIKLLKKDDQFEFIVSDNGMGIPKKQQDKLFSKMFRADNVRKADTEGTGLGLYIIKSILDNSGGKITFKSEQNKGTEFHVFIPVSGMKKKKGTKELS